MPSARDRRESATRTGPAAPLKRCRRSISIAQQPRLARLAPRHRPPRCRSNRLDRVTWPSHTQQRTGGRQAKQHPHDPSRVFGAAQCSPLAASLRDQSTACREVKSMAAAPRLIDAAKTLKEGKGMAVEKVRRRHEFKRSEAGPAFITIDDVRETA